MLGLPLLFFTACSPQGSGGDTGDNGADESSQVIENTAEVRLLESGLSAVAYDGDYFRYI